jgi:uncharacterized protein YgiM (DUF1202 family)
VVKATKLNVRESKSARAKVVGQISEHTSVTVLQEADRWDYIEWRGADGAVSKGWVFAKYLAETDPK